MATAKTQTAKKSSLPTYKEMIAAAITALKQRNGASRQALKKYIITTFNPTNTNFDLHFNQSLRKGVESGDFIQPKGASGPVKLAKKEKPKTKKPAAEKKTEKVAPKKSTTTKKAPATTTKKSTTKKSTTTTKKTAPKKAAGTKKAAAKKSKK